MLKTAEFSNALVNNELNNLFDQILSTFKFIDQSSYTACGCGCCGGESPIEQCLYKSKGDDINKIIESDQKVKNSPQCAYAGCSKGLLYKYCD